MLVTCSNCAKGYNLPDDRLPQGKVVAFPCPACKTKIQLDLREKPPQPSEDAERVVFKPLDDTEENSLEQDDLKKKIIRRVDDLPPMPKVLFKARQILADPNSSFKEISAVIETDQAIAAKVLKVANSAYYGLSGMVSSIHQASVVLGYKTLEQVITMVTSSSLLGKQLKGYNLNAGVLWRHSLAVAIASRMVAQKRAPSLEGDAFSVGLIHDAGKLALDNYVKAKRKEIDQYIKTQESSFVLAEREVLGFDHTEIAQELCNKWKLPENHTSAMRYHHCPQESSGNQLAYIVHLANHIATVAGFGSGPDFKNSLEPSTLPALRLKVEDLELMVADVATAVEEIASTLQS